MNRDELRKTSYDKIQEAYNEHTEIVELAKELPFNFSIIGHASVLACTVFTTTITLEKLLSELDKFTPPLEYTHVYSSGSDLAVCFGTKIPLKESFWGITFFCKDADKALEYFTGGTCKITTKEVSQKFYSVKCALSDY